uniref:Uncharacterized protein n=1 Tax=uncultured prokaryote TaxID=198431 RepID=A0A0H5Q5F5_9ZZZZ|nr:hypothetical protein [uncultured prokaryote]
MTDNVVTSVQITTGTRGNGFTVDRDVRYCESDMGGGRMKSVHERYAGLAQRELDDLLEALIEKPQPGDRIVVKDGRICSDQPLFD